MYSGLLDYLRLIEPYAKNKINYLTNTKNKKKNLTNTTNTVHHKVQMGELYLFIKSHFCPFKENRSEKLTIVIVNFIAKEKLHSSFMNWVWAFRILRAAGQCAARVC